MKSFELRLVTPERVIFEGRAAAITLRGAEGYLSVLYDHTPLVTPVLPGMLRITTEDSRWTEALLSGGFMQVKPDKVTIVASSAETYGNA